MSLTKQKKVIYCLVAHCGHGNLFLHESKPGFLTSFSVKQPEGEHVPAEVLTEALRKKGISKHITVTGEADYQFILTDNGEEVLVFAWIRQVTESEFTEFYPIIKVSHKALRTHWHAHNTAYRTANGLTIQPSATKAGAQISTFIRNGKTTEGKVFEKMTA